MRDWERLLHQQQCWLWLCTFRYNTGAVCCFGLPHTPLSPSSHPHHTLPTPAGGKQAHRQAGGAAHHPGLGGGGGGCGPRSAHRRRHWVRTARRGCWERPRVLCYCLLGCSLPCHVWLAWEALPGWKFTEQRSHLADVLTCADQQQSHGHLISLHLQSSLWPTCSMSLLHRPHSPTPSQLPGHAQSLGGRWRQGHAHRMG